MTINFHQITSQNGGVLPLDIGTGVPVGAIASQGLLVNADGEVFATLTTPPTAWSAGLPFDANGRLVVQDAAVVSYSGGLGFTAAGALAVSDTAGTPHYNQGVLMNGGALRVNALPTVPTAPVNLVVTTAGIEELAVSWNALVFVPAVTGYTVYWRIVGAPTWITHANGLATHYLIPGLTSGATYEVTVTASNVMGEGPQATPVTATPISTLSNIALLGMNSTLLQQAYRMDTSPWTAIDIVPGLSGSAITACAYSPVSQLLAFGTASAPYLQVYDARTFPLVAIAGITPPAGAVTWLNFSPDGAYLAAATANTFASLIYDTAAWTSRALDTGANNSIAINFDNTRVAIGSNNTNPSGNVQVWDTSTGTPVLMAALPSLTGGNVTSVTCHPTQNVLGVQASVPAQASKLYDLTALAFLGDAPTASGAGGPVQFGQQGNRFACARVSNNFAVMDCTALATPASWTTIPLTTPPAGTAGNNAVAFSHTDRYLLSRGAAANVATAFDLTTNPIVPVTDFDQIHPANYTQSTFLNMPVPPALPGQVQNLVVTPGAAQLSLAWTALVAANPVTGYVVQWKLSTDPYYSVAKIGVTTAHIITGLTTGLTYDVRVTGMNTGGWGAFTPSQAAIAL